MYVISIAQPWLARSIVRPAAGTGRSGDEDAYGWCWGSLYSASMLMRAISVPTVQAAHLMPFLSQQTAQQSTAGERMHEVQLVDSVHQCQALLAHRPGPVVRSAPADVQQRGLALHQKLVVAVDHLLALSSPALVSAPLKSSQPSANASSSASRCSTSPLWNRGSMRSRPRCVEKR